MKTIMILMALTISEPKEGKTVIFKTFPVENSKRTNIIIDNINGDVEVERSDDDLVHLYLEILIEADNAQLVEKAKKELKLGEYFEGDSLIAFHVKAPFVRKSRFGDGWGYDLKDNLPYRYRYQYKVKVPKDVTLEARTINHGNVLVKNIDGPVIVCNVNGAVEVKNAMQLSSASTVNGDVNINFLKAPKEPIQFNTVNGDFNFELPEDFGAEVYFETMHGDLYTSFDHAPIKPKVVKSEKGGKFKISSKSGVRIGPGGPELTFKSINGNVYLKKS